MVKKFGFLILMLISLGTVLRAQQDQFGYALKLYNEGFYDLASQQFSSFITSNPASEQIPDAHYFLAQCYLKIGQPDLAVIELKKLALEYPSHNKATDAWLLLGEIYEHQKNYQEAVKAYENVKILYPNSTKAPEGLLKAGKTAIAMNDWENSYRLLSELMERYPEAPAAGIAPIYLSKVELERNNLSKAILLLEKLQSSYQDSVKNMAIIELARIHLKANNVSRARTLLQSVSSGSRNQQYFQLQVQLLWKENKYEEAIRILEKNANVFDDQELWATLLALSYSKIGKIENSLSVLNKLTSKESPHTIALISLYAARTGNLELLKQYFVKISDKNLQNRVILALGQFAEQKRQFPVFLDFMTFLHDQNIPTVYSADVIKCYIKAMAETGMFEEHLEDITNQVFSSRESFLLQDDLLRAKIIHAVKEKNYKKSAEMIQEFLKKFPYSVYYMEIRKYEKELAYYIKSEQSDPIEDLLDLLVNFTENTDVHARYFYLAKLYQNNTTRKDEAIRLYKKALEGENIDIRANSLEQLFILYQQQYQVTGEVQFRDTAAAYLKKLMTLPVSEERKNAAMTEMFLNDLNEIRKDADRKNKVLEKIKEMQTSVENPELKQKLVYLQLQLLDSTSLLQEVKEKKWKFSRNGEEILLKAAGVARKMGIDSLYEEINLTILQEFLHSPVAGEAVRNLLQYYSEKNRMDNWEQIFQVYQNRMRYVDEIDLKIPYARYLLATGKYDELINYGRAELNDSNIPPLMLSEFNPDVADWYYLLGKAYYVKDNLQLSSMYLNKFLETVPVRDARSNEAVRILADFSLDQGNLPNAIWYLEQYKLMDSDLTEFAAISRTILELYRQTDQMEEMTNRAKELIAIAQVRDSLPVWEFYAILGELKTGKLTNAETRINQYRETQKKYPGIKAKVAELYMEYSSVLSRNKEWSRAAKMLEKAEDFAVADQKDRIVYLKGNLLIIQNQFEKALKLLTEFADKHPSSTYLCKIYNSLGNAFYRMEKKPEALEIYNKALNAARSREDRKLSMNNLIILNRELGFWDAVLRNSRQYLSEFPDDPISMDLQILIGLSYSRLNQFDEAIQHFRKIKPFVPAEREPEVQFYIGEAYFNAGKYEQAIAEFLKIPMFSKKTELQWEASAFYYAGQSYERLGKRDEAIKMYEEIVRRPGILWELKKEAQKRIEQIRK